MTTVRQYDGDSAIEDTSKTMMERHALERNSSATLQPTTGHDTSSRCSLHRLQFADQTVDQQGHRTDKDRQISKSEGPDVLNWIILNSMNNQVHANLRDQ
ncbi:hypothetical protein DPMN_058553 [Dreissena polymorpha]|uniref:Uncharacterized protein n=1 Tax=Dreissena polymorpha TaxID=45954 RepID=A0A9D4C290_DREPO|nr:hypothetical protein DPMN_058553 [Dreissena polymorpha]